MYLDTNGRVPNLNVTTYTGMTAPQPGTFTQADYCSHYYRYNITPSTECLLGNNFAYGNWSSGVAEDTSHWANGAYYTYVIEGGRHNLDAVMMGAHFVLISNCADPSVYPGGGYPVGVGSTLVDRTPIVGGTTYYGNVAANTLAPRCEAWAWREIVFAAAVCPATLADGTVFGEGQYFKDCVKASAQYAAALIANVLSANQVNNGFWDFYQGDAITGLPGIYSSGSSDPWMQSYLAAALARTKILHGGESFSSAINSVVSCHQRYIAGVLSGNFCTFLSSTQTLQCRNGYGVNTFKPDWSHILKWVGSAIWSFASFLDTATGWINLYGSDATTPEWPGVNVPFGVGAIVGFTQDYFGNPAAGTGATGLPQNAPPSPFVAETAMYYVVAADTANFRIQVSATPNGSVIIPSATQTNVLFGVYDLASCPATYTPAGGSSLAYIGFQGGGNMIDLQLAARSYRLAGDSSALQTADANATARLASDPSVPAHLNANPYFAVLP
jgi:hypothetical protein